MLRHAFMPAVAASLAIAIVACGDSGGGLGAARASTATGPANITVTSTSLGQFLVGLDGFSLYLFEADTGPQSTCTGQCARDWPPLLTAGAPTAAGAAKASELSTTSRSDGGTQVTYHGHPLYYYAGDRQPGDTHGQGVTQYGAGWDVVTPSGDKIEGSAS